MIPLFSTATYLLISNLNQPGLHGIRGIKTDTPEITQTQDLGKAKAASPPQNKITVRSSEPVPVTSEAF